MPHWAKEHHLFSTVTERIAKYLLPMGDLVPNCKGADKGD